ncbi:Ubiquitin carboxyl-terminal hydrolase 47 [Dermatophagoides farinae]|uniref:Ubiquitin carboxyl-terminal hydrolase 47 n=1 Tax=Dermatophagoides farinae TaxID=6954 RepID=A0A922KZB5_DERFA|nr:Ubiquitin carboxyl-terminal hydrolase 47 [Dermatophagoides farinae]
MNTNSLRGLAALMVIDGIDHTTNSNQPVDILKFRLADSCSIFQAELFAIYQASEWLKRTNQSAKIFIDSYSAILACCSIQFLSGHGKFRYYLYNIGYSTVSSCWCGIDTKNSIHLICYCPRYIEHSYSKWLEKNGKTNSLRGLAALMRRWFSGRMLACQQFKHHFRRIRKFAGGPGSIPGRRNWSINLFDQYPNEF